MIVRSNRTKLALAIAKTLATKSSTGKWTVGGRLKERQPKAITLPKLRCLEGEKKDA